MHVFQQLHLPVKAPKMRVKKSLQHGNNHSSSIYLGHGLFLYMFSMCWLFCFWFFFATVAQIDWKFLHSRWAFLFFMSHCPSESRFWKKKKPCPVTSVSVWVPKMVCQFAFFPFLNPLRTGSHHLPVMLTGWNSHLEFKDLTSWRYIHFLMFICFRCLNVVSNAFSFFFLNF